MTDLYGLVYQRLLYPGWESGLRKRPTLEHLRRLERTQWCTSDELRSLQDAELMKLLVHAWTHVPYYRRCFETIELRPEDIRGVGDLPKLPLLSRDEASTSLGQRKSTAKPLPDIHKMTSGSTGYPLCFAYDRESEYWRQATKLRGYSWAGHRPGDKSLFFWGSTAAIQRPPFKAKAKSTLDRLFRREHYVDCSDHSEEALAGVVERIRALSPAAIICYAQAGAALARHVVENKCRDWEDMTIISAAERLFPADREVMTRAFGPRIFETYGSREVMLIASECSAHDGLHVSAENLVVELVVRDGDHERPARPGELGEVVITDLHNYGAPFIRYVTGDLAVEVPDGRCACGRWLSRLKTVEGRATDTLRDAVGRPIGGLFFFVMFSAFAHKVRAFQVVQRRDRSIDLRIVPGSEFDDSLLTIVKRSCEKALPNVALRTEIVPEIPVGPGGKLRVVVVEN
jgi:phenylacetate-CoA ligase